jgi:hypothetical protein
MLSDNFAHSEISYMYAVNKIINVLQSSGRIRSAPLVTGHSEQTTLPIPAIRGQPFDW